MLRAATPVVAPTPDLKLPQQPEAPELKQAPTPKVEPTQPQPAPSAETYGVTLGNLKSLKDAAREKLKALESNKVKVDITEENLKVAWQGAVELVAANKTLYKSAILASDVVFEGHEITIHSNIVALDFLKGERQQLLDFFKGHFHNDEVNVLFNLKIEKEEQSGTRVLSTKEVFEKMALKNPALQQLKDSLGLDFEY